MVDCIKGLFQIRAFDTTDHDIFIQKLYAIGYDINIFYIQLLYDYTSLYEYMYKYDVSKLYICIYIMYISIYKYIYIYTYVYIIYIYIYIYVLF